MSDLPESTTTQELILRDIYYSPRQGFRSMHNLYTLAHQEDASITKAQVKRWLQHQDAYTKNKRFKHIKHFRHVFVRDLAEQVQMDLVILEKYGAENDGNKYMLVMIEILSRQGFATPLPRKEGSVVLKGVQHVLDLFQTRFHTLPKSVQFDDGTEFSTTKKWLDKQDIYHFSTASKRKASIVERLNRTIKEKLFKVFEQQHNHRWVDVLPDIVYNYNTQVNRTIQEKPLHVTEENKFEIWGRLYAHGAPIHKPKFVVGDFVRVLHFNPALKGKAFQKYFYTKYPRERRESGRFKRPEAVSAKKSPFSDEIFQILEVLLGDPVVYKLFSPEAHVDILGKFYEEELSLVRQ